MTSTATTAARYTIRKVEEGTGWEVVNGDNGSTMWAANRDAARTIAREMNAAPAAQPQVAEDVAGAVGEPVTGEQVRTSPVFAALSEGARETVAVNADARIEDSVDPAEGEGHASVEAIEAAMAAGEAAAAAEQGGEQPTNEQGEQGGQATGESEGASTEDVIEEVRKLHALTKLSWAALGKLVEDEPQVLLDAMDAVRTALASRTRVRVYASHLTSGQRIELRGVGVVTVADVVKVASRRVLIQWADGEGKPGEREVSSWQWTTLA